MRNDMWRTAEVSPPKTIRQCRSFEVPFGKDEPGVMIGPSLGTVERIKRWRNMARILIVDTQIELRRQLVRVLEQAGHSVTAVATISEATSLLEEHVHDLLATNVVLTDGSGTRLAKQAEAGGAKTLMITGSPDRMVEFDGSGQRYLSKPFPPEAFVRRIQEMLSSD